MKAIPLPEEMSRFSEKAKRVGRTISLVPTMGALHAGHLTLVAAAKKRSDLVVVSIFVNPIQFGPKEDFKKYPRPLARDKALLKPFGPAVIFTPTAEKMYGKDFNSLVEVKGRDENLCGKCRPGHFRGVTTVVAKLFNIVRPDFAFFGEKDYQQLAIIKKMVKDLAFGVKIVAVPTVREKDGLAMSSRNAYLSPEERSSAPLLYQSLQKAKALIANGAKDPKKIATEATALLRKSPVIELEYFSIVDPETLAEVKTVRGKVRVALAARIGRTRLIDNLAAG
jgi:pantoate--beta-alanine ligase